jgi:DNA-binding MarR family transcriptional regulator
MRSGQRSFKHLLCRLSLDNDCLRPKIARRQIPFIHIFVAMEAKTASTGRRFDSLEQEAFLGLWRTYDRLRALEDELFSRYDLTPQQYNALRLLRRDHPAPIQTLDLAARLVSRAPDITRLLDKLEQRRLVARDRPPDNRRIVRVAITAAGIELLDKLREPLRDCHTRQLGHLTRKELKSLVAILQAARMPHEDSENPWS